MPDATLPLTNNELIPIVQSGNNRKITAGRLNGSVLSTSNVSSNTTLTTQDLFVYANGAITITLPTAVGNNGKVYYIKNIGTFQVNINTTSGQTIDNKSSIEMAFQNSLIGLVSNGVNWFIF